MRDFFRSSFIPSTSLRIPVQNSQSEEEHKYMQSAGMLLRCKEGIDMQKHWYLHVRSTTLTCRNYPTPLNGRWGLTLPPRNPSPSNHGCDRTSEALVLPSRRLRSSYHTQQRRCRCFPKPEHTGRTDGSATCPENNSHWILETAVLFNYSVQSDPVQCTIPENPLSLHRQRNSAQLSHLHVLTGFLSQRHWHWKEIIKLKAHV